MTETGTRRSAEFDAPPLRRLRYFHGQMLGARDFQREQEYHREKLKLRMRCLLGYGVVCGLFVEPVGHHGEDGHTEQTEQAEQAEQAEPSGHSGQDGTETERTRHRAKVRITPGLAVDCDGNEVVVRGGCVIDLWKALPREERDTDTVWIGVQYAERAVEATRAVYNDACADTSECEYGWTEECFTVRVTGCEPPADERCDTCCSPCEHKVLWLARIDCADLDEPVREDRIHMNVRRPFGRHVPTVITGVNWIHGHTYTIDEAKALLGTQDKGGGLVVRFSGDIRTDSLQRGVVDLQVIEGGSGRNASTWYMGGEFTEPADKSCEFTREFKHRQTTRESLQDGDRLMITVRTAFILDRCCRPVDGTHVGGRVPQIDADTRATDAAGTTETGGTTDSTDSTDSDGAARHGGCDIPPSGIGPWTSGTGLGGDVFESWFFVKER
ncbi:hypothetical protein [Streptomyces pseudovenezuelae]|uniref:Uncharacterized protein n=1 Tax=Streptomyces pseudovenezuelae TaxID=67350 RepID=A0ABT6LAZ0_9ACTN|nr:hypothetical protein [Streptomyces pseudovenezuelae]MDH6213448.1 hypothetical protein [Streptomyces pseudovenezuelae]